MVSLKKRFEIFKRDNFKCVYCGKTPPAVTLEVDHVNPQANGGLDEKDNLVTACQECNRGKSSVIVVHKGQEQHPNHKHKRGFQIKGKFFHSFRDGEPHPRWQGQVIDYDPNSQLCLVKFFEWMSGHYLYMKLVSIENMKDCQFYHSDEEMRHYYEYCIPKPRELNQDDSKLFLLNSHEKRLLG